ncbi:MAG: 3-oxoacyl-[acyl-carrier-protein] synthase III C-terminal domain-containing protein [Flavobacteriales bacterium]
MQHFTDFGQSALSETPQQVFQLARKVVEKTLEEYSGTISDLVVASTCPDSLAPSLGQKLQEAFPVQLKSSSLSDLVQGCAGGVSAMILASRLSHSSLGDVLVVQADAARKATSTASELHGIFGNGSFSCVVQKQIGTTQLLHHASRQYAGLSAVVEVKLGHDADTIIQSGANDVWRDPRRSLGLSMDKLLALKLIKQAESFYIDFIQTTSAPDVLILHQASAVIIEHLKQVFAKFPITFVDLAGEIGNCGAATIGIAFHRSLDICKGKKVMLCSYGTGGVITAGLWQL